MKAGDVQFALNLAFWLLFIVREVMHRRAIARWQALFDRALTVAREASRQLDGALQDAAQAEEARLRALGVQAVERGIENFFPVGPRRVG